MSNYLNARRTCALLFPYPLKESRILTHVSPNIWKAVPTLPPTLQHGDTCDLDTKVYALRSESNQPTREVGSELGPELTINCDASGDHGDSSGPWAVANVRCETPPAVESGNADTDS